MSDCGTIRGYFQHRRKGETTCSSCRSAMSEYVAKYRARRDLCECGNEKHLQSKSCKRCSTARAQAASVVSKRAAVNARKQLVPAEPLLICWLPPQHPAMRKQVRRRPRIFIAGQCAYCGTSFVTHSTTGQARYCSTRCCHYMSRVKSGRRFRIAPVERIAIYERDGWACQLCGDPVDRDLMTLNPSDEWAPTLDHIVPQSKGGTHLPENLRLAHRWCNSIRGDETYYTEEDLRAA